MNINLNEIYKKIKTFSNTEMIDAINSELSLNNIPIENDVEFVEYKFSKNAIYKTLNIRYYAYMNEYNFLYFDNTKDFLKLNFFTDNFDAMQLIEKLVLTYDAIYERSKTLDSEIQEAILDKVYKEIWKAYYHCVCNTTKQTILDNTFFINKVEAKIIKMILKEEITYEQ